MLADYTAAKVRTLCAGQDALRCHWADAGFVMVNSTRNAHSCSMKMTEDVSRYAAELGIAQEDALKRGMEEKSKEFVKKGAETYAKA